MTGPARLKSSEWNALGQPGAAVVTDLMTSLAVIFVLLLAVFANPPHAGDPSKPMNEQVDAAQVRGSLQQAMQPGLTLEPDPQDPQVLRVVIPERFLNFDFGQASLTPSADRFLAKVIPAFAVAVCGTPRRLIAGIVIEGHTDDLGGDALNLRLSQERSLRVLIRGLEAIHASVPSAYACFSQLTSASGRGRQDIIYDTEQRPNRELSRRVIFKILLRPGDTRV